MRERKVKVKIGGAVGLKEVSALLLGCMDCGAEKFFVFVPEGFHHVHFQCANCGVSFCDGCDQMNPLTERAVVTDFSPRKQKAGDGQ